LGKIITTFKKISMIPSARFGDIIFSYKYGNALSCDLYSLYEDGIDDVAANKAFCLFLLTDMYRKLSMHSLPLMSWDGDTTREQAEELYNSLDETSHLFYKGCLTLLRSDDADEATIRRKEEKFRMIADKVIEEFLIYNKFNIHEESMDGTFEESAKLDFKVREKNLISHITDELLLEC
jgi:hypothetical protein